MKDSVLPIAEFYRSFAEAPFVVLGGVYVEGVGYSGDVVVVVPVWIGVDHICRTGRQFQYLGNCGLGNDVWFASYLTDDHFPGSVGRCIDVAFHDVGSDFVGCPGEINVLP